MDANKKVIVLSGASRGLGAVIARDLLEHGHVVASFSRSATDVTRELTSGRYADAFVWRQLDATDHEGTQQFVRAVFERFGRIDALINNAAVAHDRVLTLTRDDEVDGLLQTNLRAPIRLTSLCARHMLTRGGGSIINVSSIVGLRGYAGLSVYGATKAALDGFTRALARELGPRGVRVNSIAPGYLETQMSESLASAQRSQIVRRTPLGRLGTPEDVLGALRFLIADESSFITGHTLTIDGGITC